MIFEKKICGDIEEGDKVQNILLGYRALMENQIMV